MSSDIKKIIHFFSNGANVFRAASRGEYRMESDDVKKIKESLWRSDYSSFDEDRHNLREDRNKVCRDVRIAYSKIKK